jgi:hypothetical protein
VRGKETEREVGEVNLVTCICGYDDAPKKIEGWVVDATYSPDEFVVVLSTPNVVLYAYPRCMTVQAVMC